MRPSPQPHFVARALLAQLLFGRFPFLMSLLPPCLHSWYDPMKKETNLNAPAIKQWLANGAKPSDTVRDLLKKAYVIEVGEWSAAGSA